MRNTLVLCGALWLAGCQPEPNEHLTKPIQLTESPASQPGDTARVATIEGSAWAQPPIVVDSFTAIGDTLRFSRGARFASGDTLLWVGDDRQVRALGPDGEVRYRFGRNGDGPGEYRSIDGLMAWGDDSVLVWDGRASRLTVQAHDGRVLRTSLVSPPERFSTPTRADLFTCRDSLLLGWTGDRVDPSGIPDTLVMTRVSLAGGVPGRPVFRMLGTRWARGGTGTMGPSEVYPARTISAIRGCRLAATDGLTPSVTAIDFEDNGKTARASRWWRDPAPAPSGVTNVSQLRKLGLPARDSTMLAGILEMQKVGKYRTAIDAIRLDDRGRIWARATDRHTKLHPFVLGRVPEARSPIAEWDLIGADGRLLGTLQMRGNIDVILVQRESIFGLRETEDGDFELVRAELPAVAR
jgi:hypothetical protein